MIRVVLAKSWIKSENISAIAAGMATEVNAKTCRHSKSERVRPRFSACA